MHGDTAAHFLVELNLVFFVRFELISADMTKALVCTANSLEHKQSFVLKLYGDPDHYAYRFGNDTFKDELPIHMNWIYFSGYDFLHSMTIDYNTQIVYFGNNLRERLEYGSFIYKNETSTWLLSFPPKTNQVIMIYIV